MPVSFVDYGVAGFNGFADYYVGDAKAAFAGVADPALQQQLGDAATAASTSMRDLGTWLASQRKGATQGFALGADRFSRMILATEGVDTPLDVLEAAGRADLKRNQEALAAACATFAPGKTIPQCIAKMSANKAPDGPVAEARRQIPMLRAFVLGKGPRHHSGHGASEGRGKSALQPPEQRVHRSTRTLRQGYSVGLLHLAARPRMGSGDARCVRAGQG